MSISIKENSYKNFGRCLEISNGKVELKVTLDIGPRIISYSLCNGDNLFFEDIEDRLVNDSTQLKETFGKNSKWHIYGGHRLWISPEYITTYYPDNEKVSYKVNDNKVLFTPNIQEVTGFLCELELKLENEKVLVEHHITNLSGKTKEFAPWALTVMDKGGIELLEWNDHKNGWLSNRNLILWDYTNMNDARVMFGKKYITLIQDINATCPFKIGIDNRKGWAAYVNKGVAFVKKFTHNEDAIYPDNGCSFETYTNKDILEVETVGELKLLENNQKVSHIEQWEIIENVDKNAFQNETLIEEFVKKFIYNPMLLIY